MMHDSPTAQTANVQYDGNASVVESTNNQMYPNKKDITKHMGTLENIN